MNLNLRAARRLERAIEQVVNEQHTKVVSATMNVSVSIYQDFDQVIDGLQTTILELVEDIQFLNEVRFDIRAKIQAKHAEVGMNTLMSEEAYLKALVQGYGKALGQELNAQERDIAKQRFNALKAVGAKPTDYGTVNDTVTLRTVVEKKTLDVVRANRKLAEKRLTAIADKLSALNTTSEITLNPDWIQQLTDLGIEV